ncbi:MAG: hypothetical protein HOV79_25580 [Hamadaea sp.]|nr:hypothetical protein [Hamadaea sp.]
MIEYAQKVEDDLQRMIVVADNAAGDPSPTAEATMIMRSRTDWSKPSRQPA